MDTEKHRYLQLVDDGGPIIHKRDVCRFTNGAISVDPKVWKEIETPLELLLALKDGHRLLEGGMPVDEYDAYMEKLKKEGL